MKTLRMIGLALVAVVMCAGFAACSDDEEGGQSFFCPGGDDVDRGLGR